MPAHHHLPDSSSPTRIERWGSVALCLALSTCALSPVQPGMTRDEVAARLGSPTRVVALSAGTRLQYAAGQRAYMIDLNAAGRVAQARQVLNASDFSDRKSVV